MAQSEQDMSVAFQKLVEKAESLGISPDDLLSLESVQKLRAPRAVRTKTWTSLGSLTSVDCHDVLVIGLKVSLVLICAVLIASVSLALEWPFTQRQFLQRYFDFYDLDIENANCILDWPDKVIDFARPPVDCRICEGITKVKKVSKLSPEEFEARYAYSGTPVVITDAMDDWTAPKTFSFEFFKNVYTEDRTAERRPEAKCQFFPYKTDFNSLAEVFNMSSDRAQMKDGTQPWYIGWSNCDSSTANILRQHYQRPYFLPRIAESSRTDWIFMGSPGYGAHMHIDNVGNPSWQAQVTGVKLWTLEPPPECYHVCEPSIEVVVNPGEIIVLDTNRWFHSTLIQGNEMSIVIGSEYD